MLHYFHAGYEGYEKIHPPLFDVLPNRLVAFDQMRTGKFNDLYFSNRDYFKKLILDSGAFWAWRHNDEVNRADYTHYCQEHAGDIDYFVSLDRIPGKFLTKKERQEQPPPPPSEYKISAEVSYENYLHLVDAMEKKGVSQDRVIYVFHQGEDPDFLAKRVDKDKLPYVGLSPSDPFSASPAKKKQWLEDCRPIIENQDGTLKNNVKLHAFGLSMHPLIASFPWYSIDNSVWGGRAKLYFIYLPRLRSPETARAIPIDEQWERQLMEKWDFSSLERVDLGYVRESKDYFKKKKLPAAYASNPAELENRQEQLNYILSLIHYCYDIGLMLGDSKLQRHPYDKYQSELKRNESFLSAHLSDIREIRETGTANHDKQWTATKVAKGIINSQLDRMWLNAVTLNLFAKQVNESRSERTSD